MKNYIGILSDDIKRFINNYLIAGQLADVLGMSELEEYIPSKFPYLSILYLLNQNAFESDASDFIFKYGGQLKDETDTLKKLLGHFLGNKEEIEDQKGKITELNDDNETLRRQVKNLTLENLQLKKSIETLESKFSELNNLEKKSTNSTINNSKAIINISTTNHKDHDALDLVDMGTSVLWNKFNLGANDELEEGDYYAWGAVSEDNNFGSDVLRYKQVVKKHISGLYDYDAARRKLGEGFRIPSVQEWRDLLAACEYKIHIVTIKGSRFVKLVSAKTKNQMLLPLIGHMEYDVCNKNYAQYWTSEQYKGKSSYICQIHETCWELTYVPKWWGLPIRPVFDISNKPLVLDDIDRTRLQAIDSIQRVQITAQQLIASLFGSKTTAKIPSKKYPAKSEINESTIFNLLIKDCLPYGKSVFEGDIIWDINLDLKKLNKILEEGYSIKPLNYENIKKIRLKDLKALILMKLS